MKNEEATFKTTSSLLKIARKHFMEYGYFDVSLEKVAKDGNVTRGAIYHHFKSKKGLFTAVLESVQKDIALEVEIEAMKSDEPWQQLILGCVRFVKSANAKKNRRILLVDAPAVLDWEIWRKSDQKNSMNVLLEHINDLKKLGYLHNDVDTNLMTYSLSGALNELALNYSLLEELEGDDSIFITISHLVSGFKNKLIH